MQNEGELLTQISRSVGRKVWCQHTVWVTKQQSPRMTPCRSTNLMREVMGVCSMGA